MKPQMYAVIHWRAYPSQEIQWIYFFAGNEVFGYDYVVNEHSNVPEIGAEWICQNTWDKLQLIDFFQSCGWSEMQIKPTATQIISRAVDLASELKTSCWIRELRRLRWLKGWKRFYFAYFAP